MRFQLTTTTAIAILGALAAAAPVSGSWSPRSFIIIMWQGLLTHRLQISAQRRATRLSLLRSVPTTLTKLYRPRSVIELVMRSCPLRSAPRTSTKSSLPRSVIELFMRSSPPRSVAKMYTKWFQLRSATELIMRLFLLRSTPRTSTKWFPPRSVTELIMRSFLLRNGAGMFKRSSLYSSCLSKSLAG